MRRKWVLIIAVGLLMTSCNLPTNSTPTAQVDVLGTQVSQKLTQTAAALAPQSAGTGNPGRTAASPAPGSSTPAARSATPPLTPSQAASLTAAPTGAASATATPTLTSTPSPVPGDPKTALGSPAWKETFQKPSTWGLDSPYDDGHTRVSITNGKIQLKSYDGNGWHGWRMMNNPKIQNFYLEATFQTQACAGADMYGFLVRANDQAQGYWFGVTCDGRYNLTYGDIYTETELIKAKANPLIQAGSNQTNRVGILLKDKKISLYMNGKLLEELSSDAFTAAGTFGYFIAGYKTPGFTYESNEIAYWNLP